ncbi:MAG: polysaccharide biosynthesis/export family protein [Pyrinomonadaceae bacterium]
MKNKSDYHFSHIFLCIIFLQSLIAQVPTPTPENLSEKTPIELEANLLHLGDLIDVDVIGSVEYDWRGTLNPEGFLNGIDFVENPVFGLCRSEEDVAGDVAKAYSRLLRDPKVVVKILDRSNRPLSVLYGAVKTPQRFQIKRPVLLNELIIVSGGITDKASGEIQIFRPQNSNCLPKPIENSVQTADSSENKEKFVTASQDNGSQYINIKISDLLAGKKEANPQILSGDIVTILEAQPIYIIGGVANPKQIATNSQITLSRAIASAGGIIKGGDEKKITVFRRGGTETKIIEADLEKIKANQAEDIVLQAFDIVEIEQSGREKRKFPPLIKVVDINDKNPARLPLRIVD